MAASKTGIWRFAANLALAVVLVLAVTEIMLRAPALMGGADEAPERHSTRSHVLAVGDSLTQPHGLPEEETYTAHLQQLLEESTPGTFQVVNLGVVGVSSSFVLDQLGANLSRYEPDVVIVWVGLNIRPDMLDDHEAGSLLSPRWITQNSEIIRFIQVWQQDLEMEAREKPLEESEGHPQGPNPYRMNEDFKAQKQFLQTLSEEQMRAMLESNYREIIETVRASGARVIFATYPVNLGPAARANTIMREVAASLDVPVIESGAAAKRIPEEKRVWLWASHPTGPIYREIAIDMAEIIAPQGGTPADGNR